MERKVVQVDLSVIFDCIGGRDMTEEESKRVKDFRSLATLSKIKRGGKLKLEKRFYAAICRAGSTVTELAHAVTEHPKYVIKATACLAESAVNDMRPDICAYPTHDEAYRAYMHKMRSDVTYYGRCAWPWITFWMEVKRRGEATGFSFPADDDEPPADAPLVLPGEDNTRARAQLFKYAAEALLRQQRTHLFAFLIAGPWVRAFRFDRAGALVSRPFHVLRARWAFPNLLFRLFTVPPPRQGFDPTATAPAADEVAALEAFAPPDDSELLRYYKTWMLADRRCYPLFKVVCPVVHLGAPPAAAPAPRAFVLGRPIACHYSLTGRCTRGYVAYDVAGDRLVFFKDQWRAPARRHTELEVYRHLHANAVQFIATPVAGGDVVEPVAEGEDDGFAVPQETLAHRYIACTARRIHTRLVTKEVGRVLEDYTNAHELLNAISYALLAHQQAWEKAGVLHRDISIGNIMIEPSTGKGFLNDWDLSRLSSDFDKGASEPMGISGTWPFKSALSLRYPLKPPAVSDDIEPFVYVIFYMAVRFHRHNYSPGGRTLDLRELEEDIRRQVIAEQGDGLSKFVHDFFYDERLCIDSGFSKGGNAKWDAANSGTMNIQFTTNDGKPSQLGLFLKDAFAKLKEQYATIDFKSLDKYDPELLDKADDNAESGVSDAAKAQDNPDVRPKSTLVKAPSAFVDAGMADRPRVRPTTDPRLQTRLTGPGPLTTHEKLVDLFYWWLTDPEKVEALQAEVKYVDQFRGLSAFTSTRTKNATGRKKRKAGVNANGTPKFTEDVASGAPDSSTTQPGGTHAKRVRIDENGVTYYTRVDPSDELPRLSPGLGAAGPAAPLEYAPARGGGPRRSRRLMESNENVQPPPPAAAPPRGRAAGTRGRGKGRAGTTRAQPPAAPVLPAVPEETSETLVAASPPEPAPRRKAALPKEKPVKSAKIRAATRGPAKGSAKAAEAPVRRSSRLANK
ncbi:hypothetical protein PsYK624_025630 [Phanerochaete sordida]|uniref:Fungal-type protein kinase domain-containing protein n=1 Tax=Phanerochaete sordida TaxID=48140 RepID=A0A9P3G1E9_9APHY|nr:hypothetical protein PsYK624_025630 [Phanerochaete sordida]